MNLPGKPFWANEGLLESDVAVLTAENLKYTLLDNDATLAAALYQLCKPSDLEAYIKEREQLAWNAARQNEKLCKGAEQFAGLQYDNINDWRKAQEK